jgi:sugar lactone lactonase YvrE
MKNAIFRKMSLLASLFTVLFSMKALAASYVAVSTGNGIDQYIVNGSTWTFDHQIDAHANLYGVTYNPSNGLLYACDTVANEIISVDPTNGTETILATRGTGTTGWATTQPQNIAFGPDGKLYFSTAFGTPTSEGVFSMNLDGSGFSQFIPNTGTGWSLGRARDLTWVGTNLFVTSRDNNNVYEFDNSGALVGSGAINSSAVTGASSLYADTNSGTLYVGTSQSGVNSIRTLNISGDLPVAPGSATDSGGKVNSLGIIKVGGVMFYITYNSGASSHGAIYRLNADGTSTTVVADLGANGNDFTVMGEVGAGPFQGVAMSLPRTNMLNGTFQQATVWAEYLLITNDVSIDPGTTYSSDNTNVVTVSTTGQLMAVGLGTANVVATYSGFSATNTITVVPMTTTLLHRYSFEGDANDSVGSANGMIWSVFNDYSFMNGQLVLLPTSSSDYSYVDFGPNLISSNDAVTIEAWASFSTNYPWARLFDFGNNDGVNATSSLFFTPHTSTGGSRLGLITAAGETDLDAVGLDGQTNVQIVAVIHPLAGYMKLYINGVLAAQKTGISGQDLANIVDNYNYLGLSQYYADPAASISYDEFRIYSGVLDATNVAIDYAAGPNNIVTDPGDLQTLSVAINTNMLQQGQQQIMVSGNFANVSGVPLNNFGNIGFTSSDTNVLAVSSSGVIQAVGFGTATITVTYGNQSITQTITSAPLPLARFLLADGGNNRVLQYDSIGTNWVLNKVFASGTIGGAALAEPTGLAQDANGNVYVSEHVAGGRVLKFDVAGNYLGTLGTAGVDFTGQPGYLAVDTQGNVYMSTPFSANNILEYNTTSNAWSVFVPTTDNVNYTLSNPIGIAFGPDGNLYVCNRGAFNAANQSVLEFNKTGAYVPNPNTGTDFATGLTGPQGLSWDADNNRFLVTVAATQIGAIDTNGAFASLGGAVAQDALSAVAIGTNVYFSDYSASGVYALTGSSSTALVAGGIVHAHQMIQTILPPDLSISRSGNDVLVSWPYSASTHSLKFSTSLNPADWQDVGETPTQVGNQMQVTLPASGGTVFFRLNN